VVSFKNNLTNDLILQNISHPLVAKLQQQGVNLPHIAYARNVLPSNKYGQRVFFWPDYCPKGLVLFLRV